MKKRFVFQKLINRLQEPRRFIQVLIGPRQVGKTTLALQVSEALEMPCHYVSADLATLQDLAWLQMQWEIARKKASTKGAVLIIDEVQKLAHWSDQIKALWDEDTKNKVNLHVLILGSSPWLMQKGLTESLAGRFEITPITHWSYEEMKQHFNFTLDQFLYFGGYPGAVSLIDEEECSRWMRYIHDSLIETTLSRDLLLMTQINKPALLRRLFYLGCNYSSQILSFSKILGELHDAGNTTTLAHYLELLEGANLLCGLQKYAHQQVRRRGSSPKYLVYNTALLNAQSGKTFHEAKADPLYWGRLVESAVGAHLLNSIRGTSIQLYYWREKDHEVDFVLKRGDVLVGIEVKSNHSLATKGMQKFKGLFQPTSLLLVGKGGIPLEEFLSFTPAHYISS